MPFDIKLIDIKKSFSNNCVINGISFEAKRTQSVVLLGGSGQGKTVLLKIIAGISAPDSGKVVIDDVDFYSSTKSKAISKDISLLFQEVGLFDFLTIWENVAFYHINYLGVKKEIARGIALKMLNEVGIKEDKADLYPVEISGGMQKRVGLARSLSKNPQLLLLDEPTSGLDKANSIAIGELIKRTIEKHKTTTITITHDVDLAVAVADVILILDGGNIAWQGTPKQFLASKDKKVAAFKKAD